MKRLFDHDSGQSAFEYALIASVVAIALIVVIQGMGSAVNGMFTSILPAFAASPSE